MLTILDELKKHTHSRLAMILRHGDRDNIPAGEFGHDVLLNATGIERSRLLGESLKGRHIHKIYSSPVARCIETAKHIAQGYERPIDIVTSNSLGDPGLHVTNDQTAGEYYLQHGFFHILNQYMKGDDVPGHANRDSLRESVNAFVDASTLEQGITLFITHDSFIAMYAYAETGEVYTKEKWVNYLHGVIRPVY